eukprot:TRINITY_DN1933_c0_g2_i3.p1 TRINITY_DN1933_c0_g2~~TRINITY_DN1933_c0_g2_i3.p1  ORF type:complete len:296 (-),score=68.87 TRINITY_DN1933_c0_g2_i3:4902-5789(-)
MAELKEKEVLLKQVSSSRCFGGVVRKYMHNSNVTKTDMRFSVFLPACAIEEPIRKVPVIYWLSGLTCTEENFITKAGAQRTAARCNVAIVCPDTSPRGANIPGEDTDYDFGTGAGFYVNATRAPWNANYKMYDYVTAELPAIVQKYLPVNANKSIMGHSMGGHGALICFLKNPGMYKSVSAFSPICNPIKCPWGVKAFNGYLGEDQKTWEEYDATVLVSKADGKTMTSEILIDQGGSDGFLKDGQLLPENFLSAARTAEAPVTYRLHANYDHSYYFICTYIDDHVQHHAYYLSRG